MLKKQVIFLSFDVSRYKVSHGFCGSSTASGDSLNQTGDKGLAVFHTLKWERQLDHLFSSFPPNPTASSKRKTTACLSHLSNISLCMDAPDRPHQRCLHWPGQPPTRSLDHTCFKTNVSCHLCVCETRKTRSMINWATGHVLIYL